MIEMLVVLAVMMGLLSLLQPSVRKVLRQANAITCQNHLSQIGVAMSLYDTDFGHFPPSAIQDGAGQYHISWDDLLGLYEYDGRKLSLFQSQLGACDEESMLYQCPNQVEFSTLDSVKNEHLRSYKINNNQSAENDGGIAARDYGVSLYEIPIPSEVIAITEHDDGNVLGKGNTSGIQFYKHQESMITAEPLKSHDLQLNYLFSDAHVEALFYQETVTGLAKNSGYWTRDPSD
jgi:hypothetical protein